MIAPSDTTALPDIYDFVDYRRYLRTVFEVLSRTEAGFSLRGFARLAGSSSPNFYQLIMSGRIHPGHTHLNSLARSLRLDKERRDYLADLVNLARARDPVKRESLMRRVLNEGAREARHVVRLDQFDYYTVWYYSIIRAMLSYRKIPSAGADLASIGRELQPPIKSQQVQEALDALMRLGMAKVGSDGFYVQTEAVVTTGDDVMSAQVSVFQRETMKLALAALDGCPADERDISTLTLNISADGYRQIRERVRAFRKELLAIASADTNDDRIYQVNMQLFPLTANPKERT